MTWNPTDPPYDPAPVRRVVADSRRGCRATVSRGDEITACGRRVVAIRRWYPGEGHDGDEGLGPAGAYDGVCKAHAVHDVVPLDIVLAALKGP